MRRRRRGPRGPAAPCALAAAALSGLLAAALPAAAGAAGGRQLETPPDTAPALLLLGAALLGSLALASIGYLYCRQRGLRWDYQLPEGALSEGEAADGREDPH